MMDEAAKTRFLVEATDLIIDIEEQLTIPEALRVSGIPDFELNIMVRKVSELRSRVAAENIPPATHRYSSMSYLIMDSWPLGTTLGNRIMALETMYKRL